MAYDKNTDYQAMINDAVAKGDYTSAAVFEQQRNEKIAGEGITNYQPTNNYSQYLNGGNANVSQEQKNDYSDYLKEMYAQNIAAQLASLKSTYEQNLADLEANAEKIPGIYQASRNETAAQNDVSRQAWQEYAAANGLNTGTSGQQELASSATLQRNLAEISGKESDALAANALEQKKLSVAYQNAVQQAQSEGNFQLAQALYSEYVRQDELAQQMAQAAQAQKNWEAEFGFNQQQYKDSLSSQNREYAYALATSMLNSGIMPDSSTLDAAGISEADALAIQKAYLAQQTASTTKTNSGSSSGSSGSSGGSKNNSSQDNKIESQGPEMNSTQYNNFYTLLKNNLANDASTGRDTAKYSVQAIDAIWNQFSQAQKNSIQQLLNQYGYQYNP